MIHIDIKSCSQNFYFLTVSTRGFLFSNFMKKNIVHKIIDITFTKPCLQRRMQTGSYDRINIFIRHDTSDNRKKGELTKAILIYAFYMLSY